MTFVARLGDRQEELVRETIDMQYRLVKLLEESGLYPNPARIYLSLDQRTIPAWSGKLVDMGMINLHDQPAETQLVQDRHPIHGDLVESDGSPKMVWRPIFPSGPYAQVAWRAMHDGAAWELSLRLYDIQHGPVSEPRIRFDETQSSLDTIVDKALLPLLASVQDLSPPHITSRFRLPA